MTKLTTERLEKLQDNLLQFQDSYSDPADKENYDIFVDALHVLDEFKSAKEKLLAYEQAAEKPYGYLEPCDFPRTTAAVYPEKDKYAFMPLYAAPVLPKQPELIGMKVSIDTGSDNIGHRLFGEIVGTSDSKGVPVLCIEVTENNDADTAPTQPVSEPYKLPDGWVMVPQQIFLDASDIESICSQCGDGHKSRYGDFTDGLLWVGDIRRDDVTIMHGLHISSSDYQEEGGLTLAEFKAPAQESE